MACVVDQAPRHADTESLSFVTNGTYVWHACATGCGATASPDTGRGPTGIPGGPSSFPGSGGHVMANALLTRADIEDRIRRKRAAQDRMPMHWVDRRAEIGDEIDALVDRWLELS